MELEGVMPDTTAPNFIHLYNGKEYNEDIGWYDYGARWYDPAIGRWNAVDPLAEPQASYSPYHYVYNNPIMYWDPFGLFGTERKANRKHRQATRKLGKDKVGDVYYNEDKGEYAFTVFGKGEDKYTRTEKNGSGEIVVTAAQGNAIYNKEDYSNFKRTEGLFTPFYVSANFEWTFAGGVSFEIGYIQDRFGGRAGFRTVGGGLGFNAGLGINAGGIREENGEEFRVHKYEGKGFQFGGGLGPISINRGGDVKGGEHTGFTFKGYNYTTIEGGGGPGSTNWSKISKLSNFELGASYHWTETWLFFKNKAAIQDTPK